MAKIEKYGVTFHSNFKLLHPNFRAITLFGHVFTRMSDAELEAYLNTPKGNVTANHERIHMIQADSFKTGYVGFYAYYLAYWVKNLFKYGFNMDAYYNIPFEREAYAMEKDPLYYISDWKSYV